MLVCLDLIQILVLLFDWGRKVLDMPCYLPTIYSSLSYVYFLTGTHLKTFLRINRAIFLWPDSKNVSLTFYRCTFRENYYSPTLFSMVTARLLKTFESKLWRQGMITIWDIFYPVTSESGTVTTRILPHFILTKSQARAKFQKLPLWVFIPHITSFLERGGLFI